MVTPRPSLAAGRTEFTWSGEITGTPNGDAPFLLDTSYHYKAEVDIPQGGAEGMIVPSRPGRDRETARATLAGC